MTRVIYTVFLAVALLVQGGASADASGRGYIYRFTNNCRHQIRLAIHYHNMNSRWVTEGWWTFDSGETAVLTVNGNRIRSNNANWYYYAECTGNARCHWSGSDGDDRDFRFGSRTLEMRHMTDLDGDNEWAINCNNS